MSKELEKLEVGAEGKPKKEYMFTYNAEYEGNVFHKFQKVTRLKKGDKWQTLTVAPDDWADFSEWMKYVLAEINGQSKNDNDPPF